MVSPNVIEKNNILCYFLGMKNYFFIFLLVLILILFFIKGLFWFANLSDDLDFCLDSGICAENLELNTEFGKIIINKENCLKYNWEWNEKKRFCKLSD